MRVRVMIEGLRFRSGDPQDAAGQARMVATRLNRGEMGSGIRREDNQNKAGQYRRMRSPAGVHLLPLEGAENVPTIEEHNFIAVPGLEIRIMQGVLTVQQFASLVRPEEIVGDNASNLQALMRGQVDVQADALGFPGLGYLSFEDGELYARRLTDAIGRRAGTTYALPTNEELLAAFAAHHGREITLVGRGWNWTATPHDRKRLVLLSLDHAEQGWNYPGDRFKDITVRLVERKISAG